MVFTLCDGKDFVGLPQSAVQGTEQRGGRRQEIGNENAVRVD